MSPVVDLPTTRGFVMCLCVSTRTLGAGGCRAEVAWPPGPPHAPGLPRKGMETVCPFGGCGHRPFTFHPKTVPGVHPHLCSSPQSPDGAPRPRESHCAPRGYQQSGDPSKTQAPDLPLVLWQRAHLGEAGGASVTSAGPLTMQPLGPPRQGLWDPRSSLGAHLFNNTCCHLHFSSRFCSSEHLVAAMTRVGRLREVLPFSRIQKRCAMHPPGVGGTGIPHLLPWTVSLLWRVPPRVPGSPPRPGQCSPVSASKHTCSDSDKLSGG